MKRLMTRRAVTVLGAAAGLVLFVLALRVADTASVADGLRRTGPWFLAILAIAGIRLGLRAAAWSACAAPASRLPLLATFRACVVGEALGNLTPLGLAASEPAKVLWVRRHSSTVEAAASLAVETLLYSLFVAAMLVAGSLLWIGSVAPSGTVRAALAGMAVLGLAVLAAIASRAGRQLWRRAVAFVERRADVHPRLRPVAAALRRIGEMARELASQRPATLALVSALEVAFQAAAVLEVYITLVALGLHGVTFVQAFLLEYANRVVTVAFKFVPLRLGVDELASGMMTGMLGAGGTAGVAVAVIRKARVLCWSLVGLVILGARTWATARTRPVAEPGLARSRTA